MKLKQLLLFIVLLLASCWISFSLVAQPTAGLIGFFKMDGNLTNTGSATMSASASNITYGTSSGGVANKTVVFGGTTTSFVSFTDNGNMDFTGDFSIAFGIYPSSLSVNQGFYDNGLNYGGIGIWYYVADNSLRFNFKNASLGATGALTAGQWKAVCAVRTAGTIKLYVNGVQVASGAEGSSTPGYPYPPVLGQMYFSSGGNYNPTTNGTKIDQLRFYNRALSASEASQLVGFSLPLKMGDFTGVRQSSGIQLNWETITEQNTSHFEIERSENGTNFNSIGHVNASGHSNDKQYYNYTDRQPLPGTNFYRLKLTDVDGAYTYSKIIAVKNNSSLVTLELFPNPVSDLLQVQLPLQRKETVQIIITDATGRSVYMKQQPLKEGNNAISIPVQQLSKGSYYLVVDNREGRQSKAFIKQ